MLIITKRYIPQPEMSPGIVVCKQQKSQCDDESTLALTAIGRVIRSPKHMLPTKWTVVDYQRKIVSRSPKNGIPPMALQNGPGSNKKFKKSSQKQSQFYHTCQRQMKGHCKISFGFCCVKKQSQGSMLQAIVGMYTVHNFVYFIEGIFYYVYQ